MIVADLSHNSGKIIGLQPSYVAQVRINDGRAAVQRFCLSGMRVSAMLPCRTYDRLWREAMEGIVFISRVEDPQNTDIPKVRGQLTIGGVTRILSLNSL